MQESPDLLHYESNTEQFLKEFQWLDFQQRFGDCIPICDCVSKIWHCISTKFYEIYT